MKRIFTSLVLLLTTATSFAQNPAPCSDLFFSEYIEGTSFNKVIEIYNPTSTTIDLSDYKLLLFANGSATPTSTFTMFGILAAADVYIITNPNDTSVYINALADTTAGTINFTGNDAFALLKISTSDTIDRIGQIGVDPGPTGWTVGSGSTSDHTLIRMITINNGQSNWSLGAAEWDVFPINDFSHLGIHLMNPCGVAPPDVYLVNTNQTVAEGASTVSIQIGITNPNANPTSVTLTLSDISASIGLDYNLVGNPITVTFPGGSSAIQTISISLIDDAIVETSETFNIILSNTTNNATLSNSQEVVTIIDNDGITTPGIFLISTTQNVNEGAGTVTLLIGISNPDANSTSVTLTLSDISASISQDYDLAGNPVSVTFPGGSSANQAVTVSIIDDAIFELSETFSVSLSNPTNNATISVSSEVVTIADNDVLAPDVFLVSSTQTVSESAGSVAIQVGINNPNANPTSVTLTLSDITATIGADYDLTGNPVTVTFPGGSSANQIVNVSIISDANIESDETFNITLSNPTNNATVSGTDEIVTITNVDINSYISFWKANDTVSESTSTYSTQLEMFSGTLTTASTSADVTLVTVLSNATSGVDFIFHDTTVTWPAGPPNSQYAIFHITDDALFEPAEEHFVLTLSNFTNNSAAGNTGSITITITDNDPNGIKDILKDKNVLLIPNPANDKAILMTNGEFEYFEIRDAAGRILQTTNIHNQNAYTIKLTYFAVGIYFVCLHSAKQNEVVKLMKQ